MNEEKVPQHLTLTLRGDPVEQVFENIAGYQLGSGFLGIMTKDGNMLIIPSDRVEQVVLTTEQE